MKNRVAKIKGRVIHSAGYGYVNALYYALIEGNQIRFQIKSCGRRLSKVCVLFHCVGSSLFITFNLVIWNCNCVDGVSIKAYGLS